MYMLTRLYQLTLGIIGIQLGINELENNIKLNGSSREIEKALQYYEDLIEEYEEELGETILIYTSN